jgi:hypothetical protein
VWAVSRRRPGCRVVGKELRATFCSRLSRPDRQQWQSSGRQRSLSTSCHRQSRRSFPQMMLLPPIFLCWFPLRHQWGGASACGATYHRGSLNLTTVRRCVLSVLYSIILYYARPESLTSRLVDLVADKSRLRPAAALLEVADTVASSISNKCLRKRINTPR